MKERITTAQLGAVIEQMAPLAAAYDWDNSGWNIRCHDNIQSVLMCLDVTEAVLEEAKVLGADTVISHHPLLFRSTKQLNYDRPVSCIAMEAVRQGINIYCAHTSFDCAPDGMNTLLAEKLGLRRIEPLSVERYGTDGMPMAILGCVGELPGTMDAAAYGRQISAALDISGVRMVPARQQVRRIACVGGAGGDYIAQAVAAGADALVTGEVKHNFYYEAKSAGIVLYELGHYDSEKLFCEAMSEGLQEALFAVQYKITVKRSEVETRPYRLV